MLVSLFQYNLRVTDRGASPLFSRGSLLVNILRDTETLRFIKTPYNGLVDETANVSFTILTAETSPVVGCYCPANQE